VLAYTDAVDGLGRKLLPLCATALDLPADAFDGGRSPKVSSASG
jgi:isopenicillin N synthase-like dioxygenase